MGKTDARLHARTQADADTMAAKWEATFKAPEPMTAESLREGVERLRQQTGFLKGDLICFDEAAPFTAEQLDAMWDHIQRGRGE